MNTENAPSHTTQSEIQPSRLATALSSYRIAAPASDDEETADSSRAKPRASGFEAGRNDDMTLVENLEPGPHEHTPPAGDPLFLTIEPYSKINLRYSPRSVYITSQCVDIRFDHRTRSLEHEDVQEFLRGRYYISPSMLYSVARLTQNKQGYDVPVDGDWITIAVIAERGTISVSRGAKAEESDQESDEGPRLAGETSKPKEKSKKKPDAKKKKSDSNKKKSGGKKYLTLKLVDFGRRSTDPQTGKITIGGDALVSLILFESDSYENLNTNEGASDRVYRGGSGGAFEQSAALRAGAVIAIMNPKILKPFQASLFVLL